MKPIPLKQCYHCKQSFPASTEYFHKRGEGFHSYCKTCSSDVRRSRNREINKGLWWRRQQSSKRHRFEHRKKGDPRYRFELTSMPYTPNKCPVFDQKLIYSEHASSYFGASIDRIDSSRSYIDENVMVLSVRANHLKNDATFEELVLMGRWAQHMIDSGYN